MLLRAELSVGAPHWFRASLAFGALSLLLLVLFFPTWRSMAVTWWYTTAFNHGLVILPISGFLIWQRRQTLGHMCPAQDLLGLALLACFAFVWLLGDAAEVELVKHIAVVGLLISLFVALFGRAIARFLWFPLLFLFFLAPFGTFLIPHLQAFAADFATIVLRLVGVPVFQDGIALMTPSGVFEVAEACAGLRFIIANLVVATLFAYWAYDRPVKWLCLLVISLIVPIIANGLRVFGIVYIAYLSNNRYATGVDHIVYGWVFFVFTMLIILLIGTRFADRQIGRFQDEGPPRSTAVRWPLGFPLVVTAVLAAPPVYAQTVMRLPDPPARLVAPSIAVDTAWPRDGTTSDWQPRIVNPDLVIRETYSRGGEAVDFYVAYFAFERDSAEAVSQRHRLDDGATWTRTESGWQSLRVDGLPSSVHREQLVSSTLQSGRLVLWWYWIGGELTSSFWRAKALEMRNRLLGRTTPTAIVALSSKFDDRPEKALRSIQAFLQSGFAPTRYLASLAAG